MRIKTISKHAGLLLAIVPIAIVAQFLKFSFLDESFFYDSQGILNRINTKAYGVYGNDSFATTAKFFAVFNVFQLNTLLEWIICISVIMNICFYIWLLKYPKRGWLHYFFIWASMGLLNIYAFTLSKEVLQIIVFVIIYYIFESDLDSYFKVSLASLVLIIESITFRSYYILVLLGFLVAYVVLNSFVNKHKNKYWKRYIAIAICVFLIGLYTAQYVSYSMYTFMLTVKAGYSYLNANTLIVSVFPNDVNYIHFVLNFIIDFIRLLLPVELLVKGLYYYPFVAYQFVFTFFVVNGLKNLNKENTHILAMLLGYLFVAAIMEPDFGSVVRHETTIFMLIVALNAKYESTIYKFKRV